MQDNNSNGNDNITPYKASGNLNTSIGIPSIDVNDAMNMNIHSANTNANTLFANNVQENANYDTHSNIPNNNGSQIIQNVSVEESKSDGNEEIDNNASVKRNFVSNSEKTKKKKITINLGPEFKIALLIVVVLLVFVFLLPLL